MDYQQIGDTKRRITAMERLLYESKGAPTRATGSLVLGGIFLPICGLFFIIIANMKRNGLYISTGHNSGYIGGWLYDIRRRKNDVYGYRHLCDCFRSSLSFFSNPGVQDNLSNF